MNQATKEFRRNIADIFIKSLNEKQLDWQKGWNAAGMGLVPVNAVTKKPYRGINRVFLSLYAMDKAGIDSSHPDAIDNRWATFKQIQDKGWRVKKGAKGCKVEYYQPYDFIAKQNLTWQEFYEARGTEGIGLITRYYVVFNGKDIEGIQSLNKLVQNRNVIADELIDKISTGIGVTIVNDGGDRAFYRISEDTIHLPKKEAFVNSYEYNSTALHELSHASGAANRLNRSMKGLFGSAEYAYEELVAEISSAFLAEHLELQQNEMHIQNHKAYVQCWIQAIEENPDILIKAIREASVAADYLEFHAGIITKEEYLKVENESVEVPQRMVVPEEPKKVADVRKQLEKGFLEENSAEIREIVKGLRFDAKQAKFDTNCNVVVSQEAIATVGEYTVSMRFHNTYESNITGSVKQDIKQKIEAALYQDGNVQKIVLLEAMKSRSINKAASNYVEMVEKWKAYTSQISIRLPVNIERDLKLHGYKPTPGLVKKIKALNELVGKDHTTKELCEVFRGHLYREMADADKLINSIGKALQKQELALQQLAVPER